MEDEQTLEFEIKMKKFTNEICNSDNIKKIPNFFDLKVIEIDNNIYDCSKLKNFNKKKNAYFKEAILKDKDLISNKNNLSSSNINGISETNTDSNLDLIQEMQKYILPINKKRTGSNKNYLNIEEENAKEFQQISLEEDKPSNKDSNKSKKR